MKKLNLMYSIVLYFLMFFSSCAQDKDSTASITTDELKQAIKSDTSLVILDVRTPEELKGPLGKIDGAVNIPVQELEQRIDEVKPLKDKNIVVICRSGRRSAAAQEILSKHGIKSTNVLGGMQEFREE